MKSAFKGIFLTIRGMFMKNLIKKYIIDYVKEYENKDDIVTKWGEPLVGFADANYDDILNIREATFEGHLMPSDVLENPTVIIAYFVPFDKEIPDSNIEDECASKEWVVAYQETNEMFVKLNKYLIREIEKMGYRAAVCQDAGKYDSNIVKSKWSHRHIAKVAGLGTFGINNMLISEKGCCGRYFTIVTDLPISPDQPLSEENCLYKRKGKGCGICIKHCFSGALTLDNFDRFKCEETCDINFDIYNKQYSNKDHKKGNPRGGSTVCGKCVVDLPCSFRRP